MNVQAHIAERVRERVGLDGVDLGADRDIAAKYVHDEVRRYSERALGGSLPLLENEAETTRQVVASLTGFGPLQLYLEDPDIEELWLNAPDAVFVARDGVSELTGLALSDAEVRDLVERMLQSSGRRVDLSLPFVDASLPDGSRLHVVIPDIARRHWAVSIRKFSWRVRDLVRPDGDGLRVVPALRAPAAASGDGRPVLGPGWDELAGRLGVGPP